METTKPQTSPLRPNPNKHHLNPDSIADSRPSSRIGNKQQRKFCKLDGAGLHIPGRI